MRFRILFLSSVFFFLQFGVSKETSYYYCHSYSDKRMSAFDRIVEVSLSSSENTLNTYIRKDKPLLKTYREEAKIIAVYKDRFLSRHKTNALQFIIFEMDTTQKIFTKYLVYYNMSVKDFEYAYRIPFSKKTLAEYNRNPEILKYIPEGTIEKGNFSYAYAGKPMECRSLSYLSYLRDTFLLSLMQILSSG